LCLEKTEMKGRSMISEIIIREYFPETSREDMDDLLGAYMSIWNHPDNLKYLSYTQRPYNEETIKKYFSNHIEMGVHYYAACNKNSSKCGIAVVGARPIEGFEIIGMGVQASLKNKGIGSELLKFILKVAADSDFKAVDTIVFADNIAMLRLLLSMGFIPVHMGYNMRADGADTVRMRKTI
jgi:RimJ/RimL family protein N-acetyltransferase